MVFPCPFIPRSPLAENPSCLSAPHLPFETSSVFLASSVLQGPLCPSELPWLGVSCGCEREAGGKKGGWGSSCRSPGAGNCLMGLHTHGHEEIPEARAGALHSLGPPLPSRGPLQPLGYPPLSSLLLTLGLHPLVYPHPSGDPGLPSGPGPLGAPLHSGAPFCPPGLLLSPGAASPLRLSPPPSGVPLCLMFNGHKYLVDFQINIVPCFPPAVLKSKFLRTCLTSLILSQIKHISSSKTGFSCVSSFS